MKISWERRPWHLPAICIGFVVLVAMWALHLNGDFPAPWFSTFIYPVWVASYFVSDKEPRKDAFTKHNPWDEE